MKKYGKPRAFKQQNLGQGFAASTMMRPVFVTTLVIIAAGIVKVYDLVVAQTGGGPGISSEVPAKYVYDAMFKQQNLNNKTWGRGLRPQR